MGTDVAEEGKTQPYFRSFKVHRLMCIELMQLVDRIVKIIPEIEAARPRCSSGLKALCLLNCAIEKAKILLQHCSESSKLYLAITGEVITSRCRRSRNLLEQSLGQIQNMVPILLAVEISQIINDLKSATFSLDSSEEEAGKAVKELLQQGASASDSIEYSELKALQLAASRLHIASPKTILIEKRSIKKLLDKVGENDPTKRKILNYLLYLLKKYGNFLMGEPTEKACAQHESSIMFDNSSSQSVDVESCIRYAQYETENYVASRAVPPEEFKCPISMRLMYDPAVIASGQTFERMWIQKWFDEGNDTCPKTKTKLGYLTLTPNTAMKDLISKWCMKHGINLPDPSLKPAAYPKLETSSTSIASLGSSMNDLRLPADVSNILLESLDTSYSSETLYANKTVTALSLTSMLPDDYSPKYQHSAAINESDLESLTELAELPWESQYDVVEDVKSRFKCSDQECYFISSEKYVNPVIKYLRDAHNLNDVRAQKAGCLLLLEFVSEDRIGIHHLSEDAYSLFASFLNSEITEETLAIMEVLSGDPHCRSKITASGAIATLVKFLDSQIRHCQERAIKILRNLSSSRECCSQFVSSECIPKLVPYISDSMFARDCIVILKNMCDTDEARISVTKTNGCLASVVEILESGDCEDQEHALSLLLSLCSQGVQYCYLVMDEGVIPGLVSLSINGNDKGRIMAIELLRLLRDTQPDDVQECFESDLDVSQDISDLPKEKKSSCKKSGFFGMKFSMFSKPNRLGPRTKK
ncbi:U-box domain-containing protein/KAP domain-containing protein [Cephalotus follicularis]|uniref:RING-type E3 ubiquitin transferase n=1 Tax=Cephalotus follicularis TaxID=3775 RepID=A0A1Q3AWC3_CEPFO|nr:U-box domain-containing protein/KAP domain-containing protein [Cephalotus follicularis]